MSETPKEFRSDADWNVLTSDWLRVMNLDAEAQVCSPLEALQRASEIRCISAASPLDLFAAHRFLLTLLYWKANAGEGVQQVRESLLKGETPRVVLDAIEAEARSFRLFDDEAPFLQDPSAGKHKKMYSAGSLFAEFASGTNIAHFHHGDDKEMRLCLQCTTIGMLRVVPWTQAGGSGKTPSVHGAPPIMAMAYGGNLAITLGLNLVPLSGDSASVKWSGHFVPRDRNAPIPYLEALTWNARRIHLLSPNTRGVCWGCGANATAMIGPIVYLKNKETNARKGNGKRTIPFIWQDPSAFYSVDSPHTTTKSEDEQKATRAQDLTQLLDEKNALISRVVAANMEHQGWQLVIPCAKGNNKTFDHRQIELDSFSADAVRSKIPADVPPSLRMGIDGWSEPRMPARTGGAGRFVRAAAQLLTDNDWAALCSAAYKGMHDSAAAFDVLSGLLWGLRGTGVRLPSRNVAWLILKLMATVPRRARVPYAPARFQPLRLLPKRQLPECRKDCPSPSRYPVSFPRGHQLEADLRNELERNMRKRTPETIDWADLCHALDRLLD